MHSAGDQQSATQRVWHLYVLECGDRSLYCGIALNVEARLAKHQQGKGARYTRSRLPTRLIASHPIGPEYGEALKAERAFKRLSRNEKLARLEFFARQALDHFARPSLAADQPLRGEFDTFRR